MAYVRSFYIQKQIIEFYKLLPPQLIKLPFDVSLAAKFIPKCKTFTYDNFCIKYDLEYEDVFEITESKHGATHYNKKTGNYLILYNSDRSSFCWERIRFTLAHEIGHIMLKHMETIDFNSNTQNNHIKIAETEANQFATSVLSPLPILSAIGVKSPIDIMNICTISPEAAELRFSQYQKWEKYYIKNEFDTQLYSIFQIANKKRRDYMKK